MTGPDLAAARQRLGMTPDQMAAELGIPPHAYRACEEGRATLPRREAQALAFHLACAERDAALAESGLPECAWIADWGGRAPPAGAKLAALVRHAEEANAHAASCPTCLARERFVRERFPDMPEPPAPVWARLAGRAVDWLQARPAWARPAIAGAAVLGALVLVRVVLLLPAAGRDPCALLLALGAVPLAAAAGAAGGLTYAFVGRPLRRVRAVGPYLAGVVTVAGYLLAAGAMLTLGATMTGDSPPLGDDLASVLVAWVITSLLLGIVLGRALFRDLP